MKCPNCGFECTGRFCSLCGTELKNANTQSTPPNSNTNFINQPNIPQQNNAFVNQPNGTTQNQGNDYFASSPNGTPVGQQRVIPQAPNNFPPIITPDEIKREKNHKIGKLIFSAVVGAIILAGIVIMIISAVADSVNTAEPSTQSYIGNIDAVQYGVGETANTPFGNVTLTSIESGYYSADSSIDTISREYKFTFDIENTSDSNLNVSFSDFNVTVKSEYLNYSFTNIEIPGNPSSITVSPNSTEQFIIYRYSANQTDDEPINITYNYTYADGKTGTVFFCKSRSENVQKGTLLEKYGTDFGSFQITEVNTPSSKEILEKYFQNTDIPLTEDDFSSVDNHRIYEFAMDIENKSSLGQAVYLKEINGSMSFDSSDEIPTFEVIYPLAVTGDDYNYSTFGDTTDIYLTIQSGSTNTYRFLAYINESCESFDINFNFDNGEKITVESTVDELKNALNR